MQLADWNRALLDWFFARHPAERAYLRADDGELQRINDRRGLALEDPAEDLILACREVARSDPALRWLKRQGEAWCNRGDPDEPPPWLGFLALSVLIAARGTEQGRTAFYEPFSEALRLPRSINQEDYEATLYQWWLDLSKWLTETNEGRRGLPSWHQGQLKTLPPSGTRCFAGDIHWTRTWEHRADSAIAPLRAPCGLPVLSYRTEPSQPARSLWRVPDGRLPL